VHRNVELGSRHSLLAHEGVALDAHEHLVRPALREFHVVSLEQLRMRGLSVDHREKRKICNDWMAS
jgi:hypothetical protein